MTPLTDEDLARFERLGQRVRPAQDNGHSQACGCPECATAWSRGADVADAMAEIAECDVVGRLVAEVRRLRGEQAADRAAVGALVLALPQCWVPGCGRVATRQCGAAGADDIYCDGHDGGFDPHEVGDTDYAATLRALQARMATWGEAEAHDATPAAAQGPGELAETELYAHHKDVSDIRQTLEAVADVSAAIDWPAFWQRRAAAKAAEQPPARPQATFRLPHLEHVFEIAMRHSAAIKAGVERLAPLPEPTAPPVPPEPDGDEETAYDVGAAERAGR